MADKVIVLTYSNPFGFILVQYFWSNEDKTDLCLS